MNVASKRDHRVWLYPSTFFYRRFVFICATVFLLEKPDMQVVVHQVLTVLTIAYISFDEHKFVDKPQRFIEITSEMLLLLTTLFI